MKPKTPEWVVIDGRTSEGVCKRCGGREKPDLPMAIKDYLKWAQGFGEKHKDCKCQ